MLGVRLAPLDQGRVGLGHDILVFDDDGGRLDAEQARGALRVIAGGGDDMLRLDHRLLLGRHEVAAALGHPGDRHLPVVARPFVAVRLPAPLDRRAVLARALGHGHRDVGRVDVAVGRMEDRALEILGTDQRIALLDLRGRQPFMRDADGLGGRGIERVFVHPVSRLRHAQVADDGEAGIEAGLRLQRLVELDGMGVDMAGRVAHVEERKQPRRVPGGAGGQLVAFQQHRVPAGLRQVVGDAGPHGAAAHHESLHLGLHRAPPGPIRAPICPMPDARDGRARPSGDGSRRGPERAPLPLAGNIPGSGVAPRRVLQITPISASATDSPAGSGASAACAGSMSSGASSGER